MNGEGPQATHPASQLVQGSSSLANWETQSFQQREAELLSIKKRFGDVLSRKKPQLPMTSRFREEFTDLDPISPERTSLLARLRLPLSNQSRNGLRNPRRPASSYFRTGSVVTQDESSPYFRKRSESAQGLVDSEQANPNLDGACHLPCRDHTATELWTRARGLHILETERGQQSIRGQTLERFQVPASKRSMHLLIQKWRGSSRQGPYSTLNVMSKSEPSRLTPQSEELQSIHPKSRFDQLIENWEDHIRGWKTQDDDMTSAQISYSPFKVTRPPLSWAKFPSHTRIERNSLAGIEDHVVSKDFAIKSVSSEGQLRWATDRQPVTSPQLPGSGSSFLSGNFGKVFKSGLTKLFPVAGGLGNLNSHTSLKLHGSGSVFVTRLDTPELEELSTDSKAKELDALKPETSYAQEDVAYSRCELEKASDLNIGFDHRVTALSDVPHHQDLFERLGSPTEIRPPPSTPVDDEDRYRRESLAMTDVFVTPLSRLPSRPTRSEDEISTLRESLERADSSHMRQSTSDMELHNTSSSSPVWGLRSVSQPLSIRHFYGFKW